MLPRVCAVCCSLDRLPNKKCDAVASYHGEWPGLSTQKLIDAIHGERIGTQLREGRDRPAARWLWLKGQRWPAHSFPFEMEIYVYMVGNFDERNTLVHPVVLAVEDHRSLNFA